MCTLAYHDIVMYRYNDIIIILLYAALHCLENTLAMAYLIIFKT